MQPDTIAAIKGCQGEYSVGDTAKHFNVSKSTVHDLWNGKRHVHVRATEAPYIKASRIGRDVLIEEALFLFGQGYDKNEAAAQLGVTTKTLQRAMRDAA